MKNTPLLVILVLAASLGLFGWRSLVNARLPLLQNFEETEYLDSLPYLPPSSVEEGLAVYKVGNGAPVLLFPYPHAHTVEPMAQGPLAESLLSIGKTVITFDVPGAYQSVRQPVGDINEMLSAAVETLDRLGINQPVDVVGHSMGGLSALAFAIEHPERTHQLVLIGSMSGFPAVIEHGLPNSAWKLNQPEFWQFIFLGLKVKSGFGNLADHKKLYNIMSYESFHDKSLFSPQEIHPDDTRQGTPIREMVWAGNLFQQLDYADRLPEVQAPTLLLVGRHDAEAPPACSQELNQGIPNSEMVVFENSGHYPFLEEAEAHNSTLTQFLSESN